MTPAINIIGARPYEKVRELCHRIKEGDRLAAKTAAQYLYRHLPPRCVLIPVPGHTGKPTTIIPLVEELSAIYQRKAMSSRRRIRRHVAVLPNALECHPHEPLYDLKKKGQDISGIDLSARYSGELYAMAVDEYRKAGYSVVIVDNVIDTGKTATECIKAIGEDAFLLTVGTVKTPFKHH